MDVVKVELEDNPGYDNDAYVSYSDLPIKSKEDLEKQNPKIDENDSEESSSENTEDDPWDLPQMNIKTVAWADLDTKGKCQRVLITFILKPVVLIGLLYLFICSLDLLSSAFRLLGGKAAGEVFRNSEILSNPVTGLMIGVLVTVLVQSSSTSTSIIVTMVGAGVLTVDAAMPMIFGANIGTTVTNTIVALPQAGNKDEFRRAFAGATVHDCFNWLTVAVLLPIHAATNFMTLLTDPMRDSIQANGDADMDFLKVITEPFTKLIVQIDSSVIEKVAAEVPGWRDLVILKTYCTWDELPVPCPNTTFSPMTTTVGTPISTTEFIPVTVIDENCTIQINLVRCKALFSQFDLSDYAAGGILLAVSLIILCVCLFTIVKLLHSLLRGQIAVLIRKTLNADFPGKLAFLTGYVSMLVGAGLTILVQSSSIFTSAMTPLVGIGLITVERMYPLTLGSNIGTTITGMLAALTASGEDFLNSLQVALGHLFFNIFGIIMWYPIPILRRLPIRAAKFLGNTTAEYRWFAVAYLIIMYFLMPLAVFGLSIASLWALIGVLIFAAIIVIFVITVNVMQSKWPHRLPESMRTWEFMPLPLRSLEPYDRLFKSCGLCCGKMCKCCKKDDDNMVNQDVEDSNTSLPSYGEATNTGSYDNDSFQPEVIQENEHKIAQQELTESTAF